MSPTRLGIEMKRAGKPIGAASEKGCVLGDMTSVDVTMTFKLRGGRKVIVLPNGSHGNPMPMATIDNTIKAIARTFRCQRLLVQSHPGSQFAIGACEYW